MGSCDDGNDPATLVQTRHPGSRVHRLDQDIVVLIVPGSPGAAAQFDLIGLRAPYLAGSVRLIGSQAVKYPAAKVGPRGLTEGRAPGCAHPTDG